MLTTLITDRTRAVWSSSLGSALRTALGCTIVGCASLFGPAYLSRQIAFPSLSYFTVILIVNDATLGDAIRGACLAFYATIQGVLPAILCLRAVGPAQFSGAGTALAVALSAFVVALPESTHLITKRIALFQIVLVYVVGFIKGRVQPEPVMLPVHVVACTALGALASILALVLPYPRLSRLQVRKRSKIFAENASRRLTLFVNAFCAEDNLSSYASLSQAHSLAKTGDKLLSTIKRKQATMQWEKPWVRFFQSHCMAAPGERLQALETRLRGMEIALISCSSFPVKVVDQQLKDLLFHVKDHVSSTLGQIKCYLPGDSLTLSEPKGEEALNNYFQTLLEIFLIHQDLPSFFFLFCLKLLHDESVTGSSIGVAPEPNTIERCTKKWIFMGCWPIKISKERLMIAFKCSLCFGFAVLLGLTYSKENGVWSGIAIATGITFRREPTFKVTNLRAQGTVLGSIYGVLGCFIFQSFTKFRFLCLLPWIIFCSFLQRSRMYDQAGGISAIFAAFIILGRIGYGPPSTLAITRITDTFIALACSLMVELICQPIRAATIAKAELFESLSTLLECTKLLFFHESNSNKPISCLVQLKEKQEKLRSQVSELRKLIGEAEVEPSFWFLPFHSTCYSKLLGSLSKMMELLLFGIEAMELFVQESQGSGVPLKELQEHINGDLELFRNMVGSSIECFRDISSIDSLATLEKELQDKNLSFDLDLERSNANGFRVLSVDEGEIEKFITTFLQHSKEMSIKIQVDEGKKEVKSLMILYLSALGFCMSGLMNETRKIEEGLQELVQWENPSSHINLNEVSCKIKALNT